MFLLPTAIETPSLFPSEEKVLGSSWQVCLDQNQKFGPLRPHPPFLANLPRLALSGAGLLSIIFFLLKKYFQINHLGQILGVEVGVVTNFPQLDGSRKLQKNSVGRYPENGPRNSYDPPFGKRPAAFAIRS